MKLNINNRFTSSTKNTTLKNIRNSNHIHLINFSNLIQSNSNWFNRSISPYDAYHSNSNSNSNSNFNSTSINHIIQNTSSSIPILSPSIASIHNAALVHLHRGLSLPSTHSDAFHSSVIKGFYQLYKLETGLENSIQRETLLNLFNLVLIKLNHSTNLTQEEWNGCLKVLITVGNRPTIDLIGQWAWDSISKNQFNQVLQVWNGIKNLSIRQKKINSLSNPNFGPGSDDQVKEIQELISIDGQFFTALIAISALISNGPKLENLIQSLLKSVSCKIQWPKEEYLNRLPDSERVKYFIRSIELALMWKRSRNEESSIEIESDERLIRFMRRTFRLERDGGRKSVQDLWFRIREAVLGPDSLPNESGWIQLDWKEPLISLNSSNLIEDGINPEEDQSNQSSEKVVFKTSSKSILLTQRIIGVFLTTFARLGELEKVEEVIEFVRRSCDKSMSLYLWSSILRGLIWKQDYEMTKRFYDRMRNEDQLEPDLNITCLMISTSISSSSTQSSIEIGLKSIDSLLKNQSIQKLSIPIEGLNLIISSLLRFKLIERAKELIEKINFQNLNTTTLNHFLKFYSKTQDLNQILIILKRFESNSIQPDVISFTILLNVLMKLGGGDQNLAKKLLQFMDRLGIKPNAITYGSIVHHLCRNAERSSLEIALGLVNEIERKGIATTSITYTALIQGYLRAYVNEYRTNKTEVKNTKFKEAMKLIQRMKSHGHSINKVIEHALLDTFLSTEQVSEGIEFFKSLSTKDLDSYGILLRRLKELGQIKLAKELIFELRKQNWLIPRWIEKIVLDIEHSW